MLGDEARVLLGFPANSRPSPSQVKAAYRKKVWESHPDLFPVGEKSKAESKFKLISEAYTSLVSGCTPVTLPLTKHAIRKLHLISVMLESMTNNWLVESDKQAVPEDEVQAEKVRLQELLASGVQMQPGD
ncbi:hypothetical protein HS088_TW08G00431 [Tripterygium wilfordii]|uniref:J domain-containing protein n=1 Tax=Tripterygium wilfordii TaxID=458696 RepID=A0A7J7DBY0_TRIWF|nr:hypothetical protein HS088_TW08G00431 [Tripterygium wilfordii]